MRRTVVATPRSAASRSPPGTSCCSLYGSANRDETVFTDPDRLDLRRSPNPHQGFGAHGPHFCLGAHLARREAGVMFRRLLTEMSDLEVIGEPDRLSSIFVNGIKHLPVRLPSAR